MQLDVGEQRAWLQALAILPVFVLLTFLSRSVSHWIERAWFGRRFSTVEAVREFLGAVGSATTESELAKAAREGLGRIFSADVEVHLGDLPPSSDRHEQRIPILYDGDPRGQILLGARHNHLPYFVSDSELLSSLADVLAAILENVRLQQRKQELSLSASRSELKALRAQINPHFLFNALNSIAGLIHQQPQKADRTIEQLAEVFRYTLRGSTSEWAKLCDEVEFAEAYLDVEQARFGARLEVELDVDESTLGAYVPTMMLQTLVENAIKHGVAQRRGVAHVAIRARRESKRLRLRVEDSGPTTDLKPVGDASGDRPFGLSYIEQRLAAHFGEDATFSLSRDPDRQRTVAALDIPYREEMV
jgi:LytS/YehU family sensor histidine kinase